MLQLSLRKNDSKIFFGKPTWTKDDDPTPLTLEQVQKEVAGAVPLVLVHGYNVDDAYDAYCRMVVNLLDNKIMYKHVIGVEWPGSEIALAFLLANGRANKAGRMLAEALLQLPVKAYDFEGHSLGCRVVLEAVTKIEDACSYARIAQRTRLVVLAGAAVNHDCLCAGEEYQRVPFYCSRMDVMFSSKDDVLKKAYTLALWDNALGCVGPPKPEDKRIRSGNVVFHNMSREIESHSAYKKCPAFYKKWASALCYIGAKDTCLTYQEGCNEC